MSRFDYVDDRERQSDLRDAWAERQEERSKIPMTDAPDAEKVREAT